MQNPTISIIIPFYNAEKYIERCVNSVFQQTFRDWELILVNDGSSDNSSELVKRLLKENPIHNSCLINVKHGGVSKARNIGIECAIGQWIYFIDGDDYLSPEHLQNYANNLDADIVYQGYRLFNEVTLATIEEKSMDYMETYDKKKAMDILCQLFEKGNFFGPTWNKIFKISIIKKYNIKFNETISFREDELFTFEYCQYVSSVKVLPTTSYNYQKTQNSLMRRRLNVKMLKLVAELSHQAAMQLPLTETFQMSIERYYTQTLLLVCQLLYQSQKL